MEQLQAVQHVERYVHERRVTDQKFVNWGVYFFLLSWVTLGIYPLIIFYRRLDRADLVAARKAHYYQAVLDVTSQYAERNGKAEDIRNELDDVSRFVKERFTDEHKPIKAGMSLLLSIITIGIYGFFAYFRLMRFWWEIQLTEQDFDEKISQIWMKLGIVHYPIEFEPVDELHRSFGLHLFLTVVTVGIFGIIWDYRMHTDPEKLYPELHATEDAVLSAVRSLSS